MNQLAGHLFVLAGMAHFAAGETLYNGIVLPAPWPPTDTTKESLIARSIPEKPYYLVRPPAVIPIDVGRQLFVDDFLVESTTLTRTFHPARTHPTPVLSPSQSWETVNGISAVMPQNGGVWHDSKDGEFKMWYSNFSETAPAVGYAVSRDGINWTKPALDVVPGTNIVKERTGACAVWLDKQESDPGRRYKLIEPPDLDPKAVRPTGYYSADGIHWSGAAFVGGDAGRPGEIIFPYRNPFRDKWSFAIRGEIPKLPGGVLRFWRYHEGTTFESGATWSEDAPVFWTGADSGDIRHVDLQQAGDSNTPALYQTSQVAYESLTLQLNSIMAGRMPDGTKLNYISLGYSRDGFTNHRPNRQPFIEGCSKANYGTWNSGYLRPAGGGVLVVGDKLYFYFGTRQPDASNPRKRSYHAGLATLRRDGFASMDAGTTEGRMVTRPICFAGNRFFVNVDALAGELRVDVLGPTGAVIAPFTKSNSIPIKADTTRQEVRWTGGTDLASLIGKTVRFRFYLKSGKLYSFWVSPSSSGASFGYVGAGGPGFTSSKDTVGGSPTSSSLSPNF